MEHIASHGHHVTPVPPMYVTEYEDAYKPPKQPSHGEKFFMHGDIEQSGYFQQIRPLSSLKVFSRLENNGSGAFGTSGEQIRDPSDKIMEEVKMRNSWVPRLSRRVWISSIIWTMPDTITHLISRTCTDSLPGLWRISKWRLIKSRKHNVRSGVVV